MDAHVPISGSFAVVAIMTGNIVSKYAVPSGTINVTAVNVSFSSEHVIEPIEVATVLSLTAGLTQVNLRISRRKTIRPTPRTYTNLSG